MPEIDTGSLLQTLVQRQILFFNSHGHKNISISSQNNKRTMQHNADSKMQIAYSCKSQENLKKISASILCKVKKIEPQEKSAFLIKVNHSPKKS